ncbi:MAG: recombinase RecA [Candidatus Caldatribacteriota bacterium]|jgi:recombination protein RecA|nr:recombinase RecA [Atribacterota bacterium]MDD3030975.1 recombinase RecA [Atribacterota bacterium]MDD3640465.1 recombinase RecA [Atribacterota bacterium]MDD4289232.1 recombinase RecA [Atribacterota bacterium]MDD4764513.1 recombinase RecA [Atribacterota bacterium]
MKEKTNINPEREKALKMAMENIEHRFGKGSIMKFSDRPKVTGASIIPTGSLALDIALGIGGVPRGRIVEIYGPESSGKTTLALHMIAEAQKSKGIAAFIDAEHAMDPIYAKNIGIDIDELIISQPDTGEQALEIAESLVRSNAVDIIVIDSVAALVPKAEIEGDMGDSSMGLQARLMSQALRKLTAIINKSRTTMIFVNQIREKIGIIFGNPETTPGGRALKFYSTIRLDIRRKASIKKNDSNIGINVKVKVAKNKLAPPFQEAIFDIIFGKGISKEGDIFNLGVMYEIIEKSGTWFSYKGMQLGQGKENTKLYLLENPKISNEIEKKILEKAKIPGLENNESNNKDEKEKKNN